MSSGYADIVKKGVWTENPVFVQLLGMCPLLAVTTNVENGFWMGMASLFVLLCANVVVSLVKDYIPSKVRIPCFIIIIASFVTITDLAMAAYLFEMHKSLGLFIPLIVCNCLILGRTEGFAYKNGVLKTIVDSIAVGIGFTIALVLLGALREILGSGQLLGYPLFGENFLPLIVMILPPGAFIGLGFIIAFTNKLEKAK